MKQGNTSRVDRGWHKLQPVLEKELPQSRDRKRVFWYWLFPLAAGLIGVASWVFWGTDSQTNNLDLNTVQNTPIVSQDNTTKVSTYDEQVASSTSNDLTRQSKDQMEQLSNENKAANLASSALKENVQTLSEIKTKQQTSSASNSFNEPTQSSPIPSTTTNNFSKKNYTEASRIITKATKSKPDFENKITANTKKADNKHIRDNNPVDNYKPQLKLVSLPLLSNSMLDVSSDRPLILDLTLDYSQNNSTVFPQIKKQRQVYPSLSIASFYATQLNSTGIETIFTIEKDANKLNYGITLGGGYLFDIYRTADTFQSKANPSLSQPSRFTNDEQALPNYQYYLLGGLSAGYKLSSHLSLSSQLGLERYFLKAITADQLSSTQEQVDVGIDIAAGGMDEDNKAEDITNVVSGNNLQPYVQMGLSYNRNLWSLELGHRFSLNPIFTIDSKNYKGHKLILALKKRF